MRLLRRCWPQPFATFGADDFRIQDGYKIFTYGFPFRIVDCSEHLPMHMSHSEVAMRLAGNFAVFFMCGVLIVELLGRLRKSQRHHPRNLNPGI